MSVIACFLLVLTAALGGATGKSEPAPTPAPVTFTYQQPYFIVSVCPTGRVEWTITATIRVSGTTRTFAGPPTVAYRIIAEPYYVATVTLPPKIIYTPTGVTIQCGIFYQLWYTPLLQQGWLPVYNQFIVLTLAP
jgi:hypothetical protein